MKRAALIILTAIYLLSCVGMSITRLYCCGKLTAVSFSYGGDDNNVGQKSSPKKCCGHEKQSFKVKDSHFSAASVSLNYPLPLIIPSFTGAANEPVISTLQTKIVYRGNAPPGHPDIPVYTLNCAYRI